MLATATQVECTTDVFRGQCEVVSMQSGFARVRPLSVVGLILAAGVVSSFWGTHWLERIALAELSQAAAERPSTIVLSGRKVPSSILQPPGADTLPEDGPTATLFVVVSDNCEACRNSLPGFERLFDVIGPLAPIDVHIQSLSGSDVASGIAAAARERRMHALTGMVGNITVFSTVTGIRAVPTTLALDRSSHVIASTRELSEGAIREIASALQSRRAREVH